MVPTIVIFVYHLLALRQASCGPTPAPTVPGRGTVRVSRVTRATFTSAARLRQQEVRLHRILFHVVGKFRIKQCCGSGFRCLFDPWIRDPVWVKKTGSASGIRIRDEQPELYFRELRNNFLGLNRYVTVLKLMRIRDEKDSDPG
jgi:hypothetical protein